MRRKLEAVLLIALLCAAGGALGTSYAADVAKGEPTVRQLLLLMDTDKNGKVSRQEFMDFMAAEFDRLDTNKDGELDVKELTKLRIRPGAGYPGAR